MENRKEAHLTARDGTRLWYETLGQGPRTLVLCDGVGCAGYIWKYVIPYFAPSFRILHAQYRGHGHSALPKDLQTMSVENFAEDLAAIIAQACPEGPLVLIGHSMGVQVVLEFYARHPERIQSLVLVNGPYGHALRHVHGTKFFVRALGPVRKLIERFQPKVEKYWKMLMDSELSYIAALALEVNPGLTKRDDFRPYFKELAEMNPKAFFTAISNAEKHSAWSVLPKITVPVLVVASEKDRFTPYPIVKRMFAMIPDAQLLELPSASHIGPLELPELLNLRLEKFLRTNF